MKHGIGQELLATLWTMATISCQLLLAASGRGHRLYLCVLSSGVTSARHSMSWKGGRWTVENNLVHGCSCHVGLASSWTVIYFGLWAPACSKWGRFCLSRMDFVSVCLGVSPGVCARVLQSGQCVSSSFYRYTQHCVARRQMTGTPETIAANESIQELCSLCFSN